MTEIPGYLRVVIRADASVQIGSGHVMRGLTLADALRERGAEVHFVCRDLPGHLGGVLADKGYPVQRNCRTPVSISRSAIWRS
jgi:hypothetical protein